MLLSVAISTLFHIGNPFYLILFLNYKIRVQVQVQKSGDKPPVYITRVNSAQKFRVSVIRKRTRQCEKGKRAVVNLFLKASAAEKTRYAVSRF